MFLNKPREPSEEIKKPEAVLKLDEE